MDRSRDVVRGDLLLAARVLPAAYLQGLLSRYEGAWWTKTPADDLWVEAMRQAQTESESGDVHP